MHSVPKEECMVPDPVRGACLCGAVRFELTLPTQVCAHCHCSICRRAHGAGYVTWVRLPKLQLELTSGREKLVRYASSEDATRSFCGVCGSSLFFESKTAQSSIDVALANLDGSLDRKPQLHVFVDDRAEWVAIGDDLPRLGGRTGVEPIK
jgi:hypothetical protein